MRRTVPPHDDELLSYGRAARAFPSIDGKPPHTSSLHRWATRGVDGVLLRTVMLGGRRLIPRSAIDEFIAARTAQASPRTPEPSDAVSRRATARREADEQAARDLGI